jgi:molybdate transport system substrate-binding protein
MKERGKVWVRATRSAVALVAAILVLGCPGSRASEKEAMLAVAASLRNVLPALASAYEAKHPGARIRATYGASGDLRRQVEGGAPIDGVVFASGQPVDDLIAAGRADAAARRVLAANTLVLVGPMETTKTDPLSTSKRAPPVRFETLDALPATEKIAIGDPGAVPAGQYAKSALQQLGKWDPLKGRLVFGGDVAAVLAYARRGEVAAAIVYKTDLRGIDDVALFDEAKGAWAPRVEVVAAALKEATASAEAAAFVDFMMSAAGQKILGEFGFGPP